MQYTDNEAALIGGLISNYFLRPAVSAALKDSYIHPPYPSVFWRTGRYTGDFCTD